MIDKPHAGRKIIYYNPVKHEFERGTIRKGCRRGCWYTTVLVQSESDIWYRMDLPLCFSITEGLAMIVLHAAGHRFIDIYGAPDDAWRIEKPIFEKLR